MMRSLSASRGGVSWIAMSSDTFRFKLSGVDSGKGTAPEASPLVDACTGEEFIVPQELQGTTSAEDLPNTKGRDGNAEAIPVQEVRADTCGRTCWICSQSECVAKTAENVKTSSLGVIMLNRCKYLKAWVLTNFQRMSDGVSPPGHPAKFHVPPGTAPVYAHTEAVCVAPACWRRS